MQKANVSVILTKDFIDIWQNNIFSKKLRDHAKAISLKDAFCTFLKSVDDKNFYLKKFLEIINEVKSLDLVKIFTEALLAESTLEVKKWYLSEISCFTKDKKGIFAVGEYCFVGKNTPELLKVCMKKLFSLSSNQNSAAEAAKIKILNILEDSSNYEVIYPIVETTEISEFILKTKKRVEKYKISESEEKDGKRLPGDLCIINDSQLKSLKNLLFLIGIESILYNHTEDFSELFKIIRNLIKGKSNQTDDLCMYLLSALAKPAGYIRNSVKKVFKLFVNEISEEFLSKLCEIIKTGNVNIETSVEEPTEESNKDNVLFENGKNSLKNQEKIIKDTFLIKANDMLELILKKSSNTRHRLIVYESLVSSLRAVSKTKEKQYLIGKFASILDKISKKDLKITNEYEAQVTNIVNLCVKGMDRDKNINKVLTKNFIGLLKTLNHINPDESLNIVSKLVKKYFEKHNSNIKLDCLIEILNNFRFDESILLLLIKYAKVGRNPVIQTHSSEVIKSYTKNFKNVDTQYIKNLIKTSKKIEKKDIKLKMKNLIQKNILCGILNISKNVSKGNQEFTDEIDQLKVALQARSLFNGIFTQIKNSLNQTS